MSYPPPAGQPQPDSPGQPQAAGAYPPPANYPAADAYAQGQVGYPPSQQIPNVPDAPKRPWNVTLVAIIAFLVGLIDVAGGVAALLFRNERQLQIESGLSATNIAISGGLFLIIGAVILLLSFGLFGGSRLSRGVIAFFAVLRIAIAVIGLVLATSMNARGIFIADIAFSTIVLLLLFAGARTKAFFARG